MFFGNGTLYITEIFNLLWHRNFRYMFFLINVSWKENCSICKAILYFMQVYLRLLLWLDLCAPYLNINNWRSFLLFTDEFYNFLYSVLKAIAYLEIIKIRRGQCSWVVCMPRFSVSVRKITPSKFVFVEVINLWGRATQENQKKGVITNFNNSTIF